MHFKSEVLLIFIDTALLKLNGLDYNLLLRVVPKKIFEIK